MASFRDDQPGMLASHYRPDIDWDSDGTVDARGLQFAQVDGSVQFVSDTIELSVYRAMATRMGGETAALP